MCLLFFVVVVAADVVCVVLVVVVAVVVGCVRISKWWNSRDASTRKVDALPVLYRFVASLLQVY